MTRTWAGIACRFKRRRFISWSLEHTRRAGFSACLCHFPCCLSEALSSSNRLSEEKNFSFVQPPAAGSVWLSLRVLAVTPPHTHPWAGVQTNLLLLQRLHVGALIHTPLTHTHTHVCRRCQRGSHVRLK